MIKIGDRIRLKIIDLENNIVTFETAQVTFFDDRFDDDPWPFGIVFVDSPEEGMLWVDTDGNYHDPENTVSATRVSDDGQPLPVAD